MPTSWLVTLAGLTNNLGVCSNCTDYNTSYELAYVGQCSWAYVFPTSPCGNTSYLLLVASSYEGNLRIDVYLYITTGELVDTHNWYELFEGNDCMISDHALDTYTGDQINCGGMSSTCIITAVA